ncbi:hypothetical protein RJ640_002666 [Escallonia rubra]|uniref:Retrotransposon gag domain-containing protein n=1 Tax=Escallonia rubra TaxID=112253 RepID=A0AA88QZ22_9ASTE|nr:hypothetical protein RJ640_002666 [Escallonia rubra]
MFEVMGCTDQQKVKLTGETDQWWKMTSRMMTEEERDLFFTKYIPPNVKEAMESDFIRINQHPSESVSEYEERFALHIVQDERHRARKFRDGLRFEIRRQMSIMDNPTYAQSVGIATSFYIDRIEV